MDNEDKKGLKQLIKFEGEELRITSVDLCEIINILRREEKGEKYTELLHKNLMASIRKEVEVLKALGLENEINFYLVKYTDKKGEERPCYSLNEEGMLQMLNKESTYVRYKTTQLIKELKEENIRLKRQPQLSPQEQLALQLFNGGIDAITAHKQLLELETKKLTNTIEEQKPFVAIAKERIVKGECVSLTDVTKGLNLKKGQISVWAKNNGLLSKIGTEVNKKGEEYFKIYIDKKGFKCIGIKEKGIDLINNNLEDIKNSPCRMSKK